MYIVRLIKKIIMDKKPYQAINHNDIYLFTSGAPKTSVPNIGIKANAMKTIRKKVGLIKSLGPDKGFFRISCLLLFGLES